MPDQITASKDELLAILQENRRNHRGTFLKAQDAFRERVIEELDRSLQDARAGKKIRLRLELPQPEDHTADYDREIRMLEMHTGDTVHVNSMLFEQIVMDRWRWSGDFATTNSRYLDS